MRIIPILLFFCVYSLFAQEKKEALLLIDIQNFYFKGGEVELVDPDVATANAKQVLADFRTKGKLVVHVKHQFEPGGSIHESVYPLDSEKVITKTEVNAFMKTDLLEYLRENEIEQLVFAGMQTHMCLEAATRAAYDYGFSCIVIGDACATRNLKILDKEITAENVHFSTLATLKSYAKVISVKEYTGN